MILITTRIIRVIMISNQFQSFKIYKSKMTINKLRLKTQLSALLRHMLGNLSGLHIETLSLIEADRMEYHAMQSQTQVGIKGLKIGLIAKRVMAITLTLVIVMDTVVDIATHTQTTIQIALFTLRQIHIVIIQRIWTVVSPLQIRLKVMKMS